MKQELPNLVDERRFRRREPEQVERDEFGRVSITDFGEEIITDMPHSANGPKRRFRSTLNHFLASISVLKLLVMEVPMSSIFNRRLDAVSRSKAGVQDSWSMALVVRAMRTCIFMLRKY